MASNYMGRDFWSEPKDDWEERALRNTKARTDSEIAKQQADSDFWVKRAQASKLSGEAAKASAEAAPLPDLTTIRRYAKGGPVVAQSRDYKGRGR